MIAIGLFAEVGSQTVLTVGFSDRVTVAPENMNQLELPLTDRPVWSNLLGPVGSPKPNEWNLSLFYARVMNTPTPRFVARRAAGAQLMLGNEVNGISIGFASRTHTDPPENTLGFLRYDASKPLLTLFKVWVPSLDGELPSAAILSEVE